MTTLDGDVLVSGTLVPTALVAPANCVNAAAVVALAGIQYSKLEQAPKVCLAQDSGATATAQTRVVFVADAAGTMLHFSAGSVAPCTGNATITVDLKKNGSSILSAVITLNSTNTARQVVAGTIASGAFVAGNVFEVVIAVNAGTGALGTGVFASIYAKETAA